jgi:hypothetical protein
VLTARDNFHNTAPLYASRHGYSDCVDCLLQQSGIANDGSLHEAARNLHSDTVELLLRAGHDPNFPSADHGGRTPLGELCLLADARSKEESLDRSLAALAMAGADPLQKCGRTLPIFLAMSNANPEVVVGGLVERLMHGRLSDPDVVYEQDELVYSPTVYIKKLLLPSGGQIAKAKRVASAEHPSSPYPEEGNLEDYDVATPVSRAFHVATSTAFNGLLRLLVHLGARDRFYHTGMERVQPVDMVGAPDGIARREGERRDRMQSVQDSWGYSRHSPENVSPLAVQRRDDNDELHIWDTQTRKDSDIQWRLAEEKRQIIDRRALSEIVTNHLVQQQTFRQELERMRTEIQNRQRLDHELLQTEWLASEMATAHRRASAGQAAVAEIPRWRREEEKAAQVLAAATEMRLVEMGRLKERKFPGAKERMVAGRPREHEAVGRQPSGALAVRTRPTLDTARRISSVGSGSSA